MNINFWKDKTKKQVEPELFSAKAEALAKQIYSESSGKLNKLTQIRKFYDEVLRFKSIVEMNPTEFIDKLPYLKMLNAKAAYAMSRDLISKGFKDFISQSLSQIQDIEDFKLFAGLFEAFMGFYKFFVEENKN